MDKSFGYKDELSIAVNILANAGIHTSIYNHQLCVIDKSIWKFNRKSISDWKMNTLKNVLLVLNWKTAAVFSHHN